MLPGDSLYVRPLVLDEDLSGVPTVLLDLNSKLAHPKTLPPHVQSDVTLLSSILQLSCAEEVVLNPKTQYFILMLMAMMRDTGEHLVTCGDVDIVLPRHPRAHLETLTDWLPKTCTAAAISMIAFDSPGAHQKTGTSIEEVAGNAMDVDLNDGEEYSTSSDIDEVSGADIDAQQLHLLACPSVYTPFHISAVCMATHSTILDVMASALHQRRAWGLAETPVLGLAFDPSSTCLQTFWGWFENQGTGEDNCVLVPRVAFSAASVSACVKHSNLFGSYDLADSTSALSLAQFLRSLKPHYYSLRSAGKKALYAGIAHGEPAVWRADAPMVRTDHQLTAPDRIECWLKEAETLRADGTPSSLPSTPPSSTSSMSNTSKKNDKKAPRAASIAPSSGSTKESFLVSGQGTSSQVSFGLLEVPDFQLEEPSAAGSRVSASVFSHPTAAKLYDKVYFWGLSRTVLTHTLTGRPTDNGPKSTWTEAVQSYYDLTQPHYTLPAEIEEKFSECRDRFRLRSASDKRRAVVFEDINIGAGAQETLVNQCILGLAPAILLVVELAQGLSTAAGWIGNSAILEAAWRSLWDFLAAVVPIQLRMLQKGVGDVEVIDMLEQSVRLPQADRYIRSLLEPQGYDGKMYNELTNETSKAAADTMRNKKKGSPEAHRLKTVHQQAQMAAKYHKAAFAQWQNTLRLSTDHADAPLRSKADGLWALALNDFFDGDALSYRQANPHFLPLDVTSRLSRYQASHAPPFVKSLIHRSATFMNSPKNEGVATRLHYLMDTMISGVLGTDSSSQPASERRAEAHTASSGHDGLRAETEKRKRLPYVPLPSVLFVPFFVREYKRLLDHPKDSGVIQCRLALAATVKFLGTLSVTRRPVYGLVTEGPVGSVHMAVGVTGENAYSLTNVHLRDEEDIAENGEELAVHVFERGCNMFNLKSEQGAIAYVAFLVNLYTTVAPALATELRAAKVRMHGECEQGRQSRFSWSMEQNAEVMAYEKKRQEKRAEERKARGEPEPEVEMEDDTLPEDFTFLA